MNRRIWRKCNSSYGPKLVLTEAEAKRNARHHPGTSHYRCSACGAYHIGRLGRNSGGASPQVLWLEVGGDRVRQAIVAENTGTEQDRIAAITKPD